MPTSESDVRALIPRALFRALSDPTRIAILDRLACGSEPLSVSEVAQEVEADLSVVSRNLRQLREAGLLRCERSGKRVLCRLDTTRVVEQLRSLADALESCCPPDREVEGQREREEVGAR